MRKITHILTVIVLHVLIIFTSCEKDNPGVEEPIVVEKPKTSLVSKVTFAAGNDARNYYSDGKPAYYEYFLGKRDLVVEVKGYNEEYTYELHFVGQHEKKEYTIALNPQKQDVSEGGGKSEHKKREGEKSEIGKAPTTAITLQANTLGLSMVGDKYSVELYEKETNKKFAIETPLGLPYVVLDNNEADYLGTVQVEDSKYQQVNVINMADKLFFIRPVPKIKGVGVELQICSEAGVVLQTINWTGAKGSNGSNYLYTFNPKHITKITATGNYLIRLHEKSNDNDSPNKVYKKSIFHSIKIMKSTMVEAKGQVNKG